MFIQQNYLDRIQITIHPPLFQRVIKWESCIPWELFQRGEWPAQAFLLKKKEVMNLLAAFSVKRNILFALIVNFPNHIE